MSVNKGTSIRFWEGLQVADRRNWQSALTSPIGDVGSERVKDGNTNFTLLSCTGHVHIFIIIKVIRIFILFQPPQRRQGPDLCPDC